MVLSANMFRSNNNVNRLSGMASQSTTGIDVPTYSDKGSTVGELANVLFSMFGDVVTIVTNLSGAGLS